MNGLGKTARNERRKLEAQTINAIGLAFGGFGAIQPIIVGDLPPVMVIKALVSLTIGYILHKDAGRRLAFLED